MLCTMVLIMSTGYQMMVPANTLFSHVSGQEPIPDPGKQSS